MCGFAGFAGSGQGGPADEALLSSMGRAIAHRGPDGHGQQVMPGAGFAHVRLSIVGLSDGQQPMTEASGRFTIVFNGEIFNYVELRRDLEQRGVAFRTGSDTEVLLQLYATFGEACLSRLNGDFAFAIWDARERRLVLARDRMGVRPLFYTQHGDRLYFASEAKALLTAPGMTAEMDLVALDQIFTLWAPIAPRTAFKGISEVEPGQMLTLQDGRLELRSYWSLDYPALGEHAPRDAAEVDEELRGLLEEATRLRMRADVPVGAYLSGGLDSSLITALAAPMALDRLNTFSVTFDDAEHDESRFQRAVAEAFGTRHHSVACGSGDIATDFPDVVRAAERPFLRTAPAPLFALARLVRRSGMKVVLTGEGADEMFAGYDIFREARVRRFCARQPGSKIRPHLFRKLYPYLPGLKQQSPEYLAAFFGASGDAAGDLLFSHRPRFRSTAATKVFYSDALRQALGGYDAAEDLASRLPADFRRWHPLNQAQYLETRFLLPGYILSSQGDRMAMAHGVEGRFPFLDHRLVEFANRLPPDMKLKGLEEKHVLRRVARSLVPDVIVSRPKQPYRAPDSSSFTGAAEPAYLAEVLEASAVAGAGLFNPSAVSRLLVKCRGQTVAGFRDNAAFVGILSAQLWKREFASQNRPVWRS
jgi:asparagine synthase (glutamine-hydrolysing)